MIAKRHIRTGHLVVSLIFLLVLFQSTGQQEETAPSILLHEAELKANASDFESAIELYAQAAKAFQNSGELFKAGLAYVRAGDIARTLENIPQANHFMELAAGMDPPDRSERILLLAEIRHLNSNLLLLQSEYTAAIHEMKEALKSRYATPLSTDSSIAVSMNSIGTNYFWLNRLDSALHYYRLAASSISEREDSLREDRALYLQNIGIIMAIRGKLDSALRYMKSASDIYEAVLPEDDPDLARSYLNLGRLYRTLGDDPKALEFNTKAEKVFVKHFGTDYAELGILYLNTGNILKVMGDYEKAIDYYRKSLHIYTSGDNPNHPNIARIYNNLGAVHMLSNEDSLAEHYLKKSLEIGQLDLLGLITYRNLATIQERKGNFQQALAYLDMASELAAETLEEDHYELGNIALDYGLVFAEMKEYEKAGEEYDEAIAAFRKTFGNRHPDLAEAIGSKASLMLELKDYQEALALFQESLIALSPNFNDTDPLSNPEPGSEFVSVDLLDPIIGKANALWGLFKASGEKEYLSNSLVMFREASQLVDVIRNQVTDNSKQMLTQTQRDLYDKGIRNALELYSLTGEEDLKETAFNFAEKSKYTALLASMRDVEAREFAGIPDSLRQKEKEIGDRISTYVKLINDEKLSTEPNDEKLATWESLVFDMKREQEELVRKYEEEYPRYFRLKYDTRIISIADIQERIDDNTVLVEYFLGDSTLNAFFITSEQVQIHSTEYDSTLIQQIQVIRNSLNPAALSQLNFEQFKLEQQAAHSLYETLLSPEVELIQGKNLIIIPDDVLGYLSFDLLLTQKMAPDRIDYRNLPYLIRDHEISYSYLATLTFSREQVKKRHSGDVVAFAPSYEHIEDIPEERLISLRGMEKYLLPIEHAREEMELVKRLTGADVYVDDNASEKAFKENATDEDIIHLAMHTIIDDQNPMFSKLAFTLKEDGAEDGLLNTYEIYNMDFNAHLVVLSACNTGSGVLQRGEGIISLARAFMYAGVPSIVMTLWAVEDKSGYDIMEGFYSNLTDGQSKRQALRNAKLEYLEGADNLRSHPYFWAAYVSIGDDSAIYTKNKHAALIAAACLVSVALILFFLIRRRRKTNL